MFIFTSESEEDDNDEEEEEEEEAEQESEEGERRDQANTAGESSTGGSHCGVKKSVFKVTCGAINGMLHKDRFASGTNFTGDTFTCWQPSFSGCTSNTDPT